MRFGKQLGQWIYQRCTWQKRLVIQRLLSESNQWPAAIIFYHRVANHPKNDWTISRRDFARHLDWLTEKANITSLADVQRSQRSATRSRLSVTITFDDGYSENCDWAIPELISRGMPCTYFVTNNFIKSGQPFPHDKARGAPLRPNSVDEIKRMADSGVEIGGHTATHLNLGQNWSRQRLLQEIRDSRHELQDWTGQSVNYFAFPYGLPQNVSQASIDIVCEAGYIGFVSAYGGWNWPGEDSFHLQRIHGDPGLASLSNWLTLDPRKLKHGSQIHYTRPPQLTFVEDQGQPSVAGMIHG